MRKRQKEYAATELPGEEEKQKQHCKTAHKNASGTAKNQKHAKEKRRKEKQKHF